jgi:hypothetical protein
MPTYFLKFRTGNVIEDDGDGLELSDIEAARREALLTAREIVADAVQTGRDNHPDEIQIFDQGNNWLSTVRLVDVVPRRLRE